MNKKEVKEQPLKEYRLHGTREFPCAMYHVETEANRKIFAHHWHDETELIYFSKGEFLLDISAGKFPVDSPCFCLIHQGELHSLQAISAGVEDAVVFDPRMISSDTYDAVQQKVIRPIIEGGSMFPRFIYEGDPGFEQMQREFGEMEQVFLEKYEGQQYEDQKLVFDLPAQLLVKGVLMKILAVLAAQGTGREKEREDPRSAET